MFQAFYTLFLVNCNIEVRVNIGRKGKYFSLVTCNGGFQFDFKDGGQVGVPGVLSSLATPTTILFAQISDWVYPLTYNRSGLLDQYFLPEVMRGQLNVTNTDEC